MLSFFQNVILSPIVFLGKLFWVNKNVWVFGSWSGKFYNDNAKYIFEYVRENNPEIRAVWITNNPHAHRQLTKEKKECYMFSSWRSIFICLFAGTILITDSWGDVPVWAYFNPRRKRIIQLWHGTLLRKVNLKAGSTIRKIWRGLFIAYLGREYDLVISATQKNHQIFLDLFNTKNIQVTGQPRIDGLFQYKGLLRGKYPNQKIIMYLPTWRDNGYMLFTKKNKFDYNKLNTFLIKQKAVLIIKIHPYDLHKYRNLPKSKHIEFTVDMDDVYMYLQDVDILLTDYSSVFFDYLLLNRPIVFAPFDLEAYEKQHGFYYNYGDITPGPKVTDWDKVIFEMKKYLLGKDSYRLKREKICKIFNAYNDSKNSRRAYKEIVKVKL